MNLHKFSLKMSIIVIQIEKFHRINACAVQTDSEEFFNLPHTRKYFFKSALPLISHQSNILLISNPQFFSDSMNFMWPTSLGRQKIRGKKFYSQFHCTFFFLIRTEAKYFSTRFANFIFLLIWSSLNRLKLKFICLNDYSWSVLRCWKERRSKKLVFNIFHSCSLRCKNKNSWNLNKKKYRENEKLTSFLITRYCGTCKT